MTANSNVTALQGFSVPSRDPVERVVQLLEEALLEAKSGKMIGLAMVAVLRDPEAFETRFHAEQLGRHSLGAGVLALGFQIGRELTDDG